MKKADGAVVTSDCTGQSQKYEDTPPSSSGSPIPPIRVDYGENPYVFLALFEDWRLSDALQYRKASFACKLRKAEGLKERKTLMEIGKVISLHGLFRCAKAEDNFLPLQLLRCLQDFEDIPEIEYFSGSVKYFKERGRVIFKFSSMVRYPGFDMDFNNPEFQITLDAGGFFNGIGPSEVLICILQRVQDCLDRNHQDKFHFEKMYTRNFNIEEEEHMKK